MTLYQKSTAEDIGLRRTPYLQPCHGMNINDDVIMDDTSVLFRGLSEPEFHNLLHVRVTEHVPSLNLSLPNMLELDDHLNFQGIDYLTLDRTCCDLLIATDHVELLLSCTGNEFRRISGNLHATRTCVGWIIARNEHAMTCRRILMNSQTMMKPPHPMKIAVQ